MSDIKQRLDAIQQQLSAKDAPFEIITRDLGTGPLPFLKNAPNNLKEAIDKARDFADQEAIVFGDERWTYKDLFSQADAIGYQLIHALKLSKGDRVAIAMRNYPEWMTAYIGIISVGLVAVPINSWGQRDELLYGLSDSGARAVFCDQRRFDAISDQLEILHCVGVVARPESDARPEQEIANSGTSQTLANFIAPAIGKPLPEISIDPLDYAHMLYTSGTTGRPKGAISSHLALAQTLFNFEFSGAISAVANMPVIEKMQARGYSACGLLAVPLFHTSGLYPNFLLSIRNGNKTVMMHKWDTAQALKLIEQERITLLNMVPALLWDLLNHKDFDQTDTQSLFMLGSGGSSSPAGLKAAIEQKVTDVYPGTGYGLTETNTSISSMTGEAYKLNPKSAGFINPLMQIKLCDENGVKVGENEVGEIVVRAITMIDKYWNRPEATQSSFKDGWFLTGDVGRIDAQGYLYIVDRIKDMVIRGGENIYCGEVENAIYELDSVYEVAAFGLPHEKLGEELAVAVVTRPEQTLTAEQLQEHTSKLLAGFKIPSKIFFRDTPLPRNASKKVLKKDLQAEYLN